MTPHEMWTRGAYNYCNQTEQPDGSVLVTLTKRGDPHVYRMWVTGLGTPQERVLKEEITGG